MTIFYEKGAGEGVLTLSEEESRHCSQVLRHKSGDEILIFDGIGGKYHAILNEVSKKTCTFDIVRSEIEPEKDFYTHLVIAPTKNSDRMEWMIEKLGEIGLDELTFIRTQRSERKNLRLDRLEKKAISAMKQSGSPFKLKINEMVDLVFFVKQADYDHKLIAHVDQSHPYLISQIDKAKKICILVGPEGDFTNQELSLSLERGFKPISLGKNTLRTETAGLIACCLVNSVNNF